MSGPNLRESIRKFVPVWLSDRPGLNVGFRVLWGVVLLFDAAIEWARQGLRAKFPGLGPSDAMPYLGADRRTYRSPSEGDASYAARLLTWLDRWRLAGQVWQLMRELQAYIPSHPKIRVYNRAGFAFTLNTNGTTSVCKPIWVGQSSLLIGGPWSVNDNGCGVPVWDWDSVSHPERAGFWSEMWVVLYSAYPEVNRVVGTGTIGADADTNSLRQTVTQSEVYTVKAIVDDFKAAHTRVRAVMFTSVANDFNPADVGALRPDGTWGEWNNVAFQRPDHVRFWEITNVE